MHELENNVNIFVILAEIKHADNVGMFKPIKSLEFVLHQVNQGSIWALLEKSLAHSLDGARQLSFDVESLMDSAVCALAKLSLPGVKLLDIFYKAEFTQLFEV